MIGLVFSSAEEAEPFLKRYERGRFEGLEEAESAQDGVTGVAITGMGKVKATLRTERFLREMNVDRVIHAVLCTALEASVPIGTVVGATQVFEGDRIELAAPTYPRMPLDLIDPDLRGGTLVTQDHLIGDEEERSYWQRIANFIDSTGYAVSYVAATHGKSNHIVMGVSGHLSESSATVRTSREESARNLADYLIDLIPKLTSQ